MKKYRAQSAKLSYQGKRLNQQAQKVVSNKIQTIQKVYNQTPFLQDRPVSGNKKSKINSQFFNKLPSHSLLNNNNIQILTQQNIILKKKNNFLQQQMLIMRNKFESLKTKRNKKDGGLTVQFENENLWNGNNTYLVTGVKNQYQILKHKLKEQIQSFNNFKNQLLSTNYLQLKKQNNILKKQNTKLIESLVREQNRSRTISSSTLPNYDYKALQLLSEELSHKNHQLQQKINKLNQKIKQTKYQSKQQQSKIKFLQKLIIQKDNTIHGINKNYRKSQKNLQHKNIQLENFKNQIEAIREQYEYKINQIQKISQQKRIQENFIFQRALREKSTKIQNLQKQIAYLTTLMSYWKPLDDKSVNQIQTNKQQSYNNLNSNRTMKQQSILTNQNSSLNYGTSILSAAFKQNSFKEFKEANLVPEQPRQQKRADKKRSEYSQKSRAVKSYQIQQLGQILRLRMIAQRIQSDEIKKFIQFKDKPNLSEDQKQWRNEYITMKESIEILMGQPFLLSNEQSKTLSKYLIEDVIQDYVYSDLQNENKRRIVESILKNLIGQYQISKSLNQIERETKIQLEKYRAKIATILDQMYPGGLVTKKKLMEIFIGSGFEISEQIMEYILGKLMMKSGNLNCLNFKILF